MELNMNTNRNPPGCLACSRGYAPALLSTDLIPVVVESAFVLSLVTIAIVMRMQKLTPGQFFWLGAILLGIFFVATMMFYVRYS